MTDCVINWTMVLQYLNVFLSWPAVTLYLVVLFLFRFRVAVEQFIYRLRSGKVGPLQWSTAPVAQENVDAQLQADPQRAQATLAQWFVHEKTLNNIFGSQLEFLWYLRARPEGVGFLELMSFYGVHKQRLPNSPTEVLAWVRWLVANNLVITNAEQTHYLLSERGGGFLAYLATYYPAGVPPRIG